MTTIKIKTILSYLIVIVFAGCIFSSCNDNDELIEENTNTRQSYHLEGTVKYGAGKVTNIQKVHLYDSNGREVNWKEEIPELEYIINESLNKLDL